MNLLHDPFPQPSSAETHPPALSVKDLTVTLGARKVLEGVSLDVAAGEVHAILGANGAGKSSLLRSLSGELSVGHGEIDILGQAQRKWSVARLARVRAVVPQHSNLAFPLTALEVVLLGRSMHPGRGDLESDHQIALEALDSVGLAARANQVWPSLSGGERQRVQFARALAQITGAPPFGSVLLLDEPTASLDPAHQHLLLQTARRQAERNGTAVVSVLHDVNLARVYADSVCVLRAGILLASGATREVLKPEVLSTAYGVACAYSHELQERSAHLILGPEAEARSGKITSDHAWE